MQKEKIKFGFGYDTHRYKKGLKLFLGGTLIPHTHGMLGHSDGDLVLHAICDGALGAICAGEIGEYFPPTDKSIKGISSVVITKKILAILKKKNAKIAKLFYSTEKATTIKDDICSLVRIKLLTGRTHQIRVQFANQGHPLFGDGKYGAKDNSDLALHCSKISFAHPNDGVTMMFSSEPPDKEPWNTFFKNINMAK